MFQPDECKRRVNLLPISPRPMNPRLAVHLLNVFTDRVCTSHSCPVPYYHPFADIDALPKVAEQLRLTLITQVAGDNAEGVTSSTISTRTC